MCRVFAPDKVRSSPAPCWDVGAPHRFRALHWHRAFALGNVSAVRAGRYEQGPHYAHARAINSVLRALSPLLMSLTSTGVFRVRPGDDAWAVLKGCRVANLTAVSCSCSCTAGAGDGSARTTVLCAMVALCVCACVCVCERERERVCVCMSVL